MIHAKGKSFILILGLSALLVEACAAFFSVYGLSKLFAGASTAVILMAASLEIAKVVTASFLYRKWSTIHFLMKTYLTVGVVVLITITSLGIYGFLSNAFQSSTLGFEKQTTQLILYEDELKHMTEDRNGLQLEKRDLQNNLNAELRGLSMSDTSRRYLDASYRKRANQQYQPLIDQKEKQIIALNEKIQSVSEKVTELRVDMVQSGADVGPIVFVARAFNVEVNVVVQYLIFIFIAVFDPLAVVLVIATNKAWLDYQDENKHQVVAEKASKPRGKWFKRPPTVSTDTPVVSDPPSISEGTPPVPAGVREVEIVEIVRKKGQISEPEPPSIPKSVG